jgi:putative hydrolase of HD superfamily
MENMKKEKIVTALFYLTNKLKDKVQRNGWHQKEIKRNRVESVADHIFGCQMLAYAMYSEFDYDIDIDKVILMLAVHEIGETIIGDITPDDMPSKMKNEIERNAVIRLCELIPNGDFIKELFLEFEEKKTKEAQFAFQVDKAECDLQAKLYIQEGCFDHKYDREEFIDSWIGFDRKRIPFDKNFSTILEYIMENDMKVLEHQEDPIQNVVSFYTSTNKLKDTKRAGEEIWHIKKIKYGSIAEHTYSVEMLEIITYLVFNQNIDIKNVISQTSIHDIGELLKGDISSLLKTEKDRDEEFGVSSSIASILTKGDLLINYIKQFNSGKTKESKYSKYCDKLAPDIISKIYDKENLIDLDNQDGNPLLDNPIVKKYLNMNKEFSSMWILYGQEVYNYPEPFISISNYVLNNEIEDSYTTVLKREGYSKLD